MFANQTIRNYARSKGVFFYEIAEVLCISEPTMTRRLRKELTDKEKTQICKIIDELAAGKTATVVVN